MDRVDIIKDLLTWLDSHLDTPLSLDNVAAKSGYSKWHLQRMFKEVTGQAIGAYIRKRRLSKAAGALRLTGRSILEIAIQYHFDSQQTFTRAFKKQFNQTPAHYRRNDQWDTSGLCPPIMLGKQDYPQVEYTTLPELKLIGMRHKYTCSLNQLAETLLQFRIPFWLTYVGDSDANSSKLYGLHHVQPSPKADDEQEVFYTTAIEFDKLPPGINGELIIVPANRYAKFHYAGSPKGLQDFILTIYTTCLPMLNLTRTKAYDIEIFQPNGSQNPERPEFLKCDYFIPIAQ